MDDRELDNRLAQIEQGIENILIVLDSVFGKLEIEKDTEETNQNQEQNNEKENKDNPLKQASDINIMPGA